MGRGLSGCRRFGTHDLVIGHGEGEEHDHDHADGHHHHHHGNENELDVAVMPVASLGEADLAAARESAVKVFFAEPET